LPLLLLFPWLFLGLRHRCLGKLQSGRFGACHKFSQHQKFQGLDSCCCCCCCCCCVPSPGAGHTRKSQRWHGSKQTLQRPPRSPPAENQKTSPSSFQLSLRLSPSLSWQVITSQAETLRQKRIAFRFTGYLVRSQQVDAPEYEPPDATTGPLSPMLSLTCFTNATRSPARFQHSTFLSFPSTQCLIYEVMVICQDRLGINNKQKVRTKVLLH
jgi:hypothetical protein